MADGDVGASEERVTYWRPPISFEQGHDEDVIDHQCVKAANKAARPWPRKFQQMNRTAVGSLNYCPAHIKGRIDKGLNLCTLHPQVPKHECFGDRHCCLLRCWFHAGTTHGKSKHIPRNHAIWSRLGISPLTSTLQSYLIRLVRLARLQYVGADPVI